MGCLCALIIYVIMATIMAWLYDGPRWSLTVYAYPFWLLIGFGIMKIVIGGLLRGIRNLFEPSTGAPRLVRRIILEEERRV